MARELKSGIAAVAPTTSAALGILAIASGVYTYIGVKGLLDGSSTFTAGAAVAYSTAVSVGIYVFWTYILRFFPLLRSFHAKVQMIFAMILGSVAIIAMSSWLNAAALAGSAAVEQHLAKIVEEYQESLEQAHENALAAQALLPDIRIAAANFRNKAIQERDEGALTGTSGSGTVVQLLTQMASQLDELAAAIEKSRDEVASLFEQGTVHLKEMRDLVASQGPVAERSVSFAEDAAQVAALIAELKQTSVAPAVKRAAENLERSFVAPAPDGQSEDLRTRQEQVVESVRATVRDQSRVLSEAADKVLAAPPAVVPRFTPISTAEAVLLYWRDFVPSWAGAIAIDLLPAVIVFMQSIIFAAIRRHEEPLPIEETLTLKDIEVTLAALGRIDQRRAELATAQAGEAPAEEPEAPAKEEPPAEKKAQAPEKTPAVERPEIIDSEPSAATSDAGANVQSIEDAKSASLGKQTQK